MVTFDRDIQQQFCVKADQLPKERNSRERARWTALAYFPINSLCEILHTVVLTLEAGPVLPRSCRGVLLKF